jgi:epoxyqueuosine reductase
MLSSRWVVSRALDLGFDVAGVAAAFPVPTLNAYRTWVSCGYHGQMDYLARRDRVLRRTNPDIILPGVRAVVCVGLNYYQNEPVHPALGQVGRGRISRYAWGVDYHDLMLPRLEALMSRISAASPGASHRCYVDTGPVLERAYAARAGLGFIGKNSCLISPIFGPWLFLGEILTTAELEPTDAESPGDCGPCRRCMYACPTDAIIAPYIVDARKCLAYLTIEYRGAIAENLRPLLGDRVFGCDACQEACPWHRFARVTKEPQFRPRPRFDVAPHLAGLAGLSPEAFRQRYGGRPIARARRDGLARNAVVALGNWGDRRAVGPLRRAMTDADPIVRDHAEWALASMARNNPEEFAAGGLN